MLIYAQMSMSIATAAAWTERIQSNANQSCAARHEDCSSVISVRPFAFSRSVILRRLAKSLLDMCVVCIVLVTSSRFIRALDS